MAGIAHSRSGQVCIVTLTGRIDSSNAGGFMARFNTLIASGKKNILVDFGAVPYLTSAAFRALLVASDQAERNAARLTLCSLIRQLRELFEMGGLLDAFTILDSPDEALARLN